MADIAQNINTAGRNVMQVYHSVGFFIYVTQQTGDTTSEDVCTSCNPKKKLQKHKSNHHKVILPPTENTIPFLLLLILKCS